MKTYTPDAALTKAVLEAILAPIPFLAGIAIKAIPTSVKEGTISLALAQVVPLSLGSIALTQKEGARIALTKHGELKEDVKAGMVRRIATWFVPNEVKQVTAELQKDVVKMAQGGYATDSWRLEIVSDEVVLVVLNTSLVKHSTDTVVDLFFASNEKLKALKDKILQYVPSR